jgi:hypothetical protein
MMETKLLNSLSDYQTVPYSEWPVLPGCFFRLFSSITLFHKGMFQFLFFYRHEGSVQNVEESQLKKGFFFNRYFLEASPIREIDFLSDASFMTRKFFISLPPFECYRVDGERKVLHSFLPRVYKVQFDIGSFWGRVKRNLYLTSRIYPAFDLFFLPSAVVKSFADSNSGPSRESLEWVANLLDYFELETDQRTLDGEKR